MHTSPEHCPALVGSASARSVGGCRALHALDLSSGSRDDGLPRGLADSGLQWNPEDAGIEAAPGEGATVECGTGSYGGLPGAPFTDWTRHQLLWQQKPRAARDAENEVRQDPASTVAAVRLRLPITIRPQEAFQARLQNPHAVCYMNACVQAYTWIRDLATTSALCHGRLQVAITLLRKPLKPYLPSCLPCATGNLCAHNMMLLSSCYTS